jgi:hypothetical protein
MTLLDEKVRQNLLERLRSLQADSPRQWGTMTAHQMVCHFSDAMRVTLGDTPSKKRGTLVHRTLVKWIVLYLPMPVPKGKIKTVPEMLSTQPEGWESDLQGVEKLIERFATAKELATHPVFGSMSKGQWGILAGKHLDHHLRQFGA